MEELEQPTEHVQEQIHERAEEAREKEREREGAREPWVGRVALTTALLAALAAVTSLLSGHHEHEAMLKQIEAADTWSRYQAKGVKSILIEDRLERAKEGGIAEPAGDRSRLERYARERKDIF